MLAFIGVHLLRNAISTAGEARRMDSSYGLAQVAASMARSLDPLAAGLSLALLHVRILLPSLVVGLTTGCISLAGILLGVRLSKRLGRRAELAGGAVMLLVALRILLEHLGPLSQLKPGRCGPPSVFQAWHGHLAPPVAECHIVCTARVCLWVRGWNCARNARNAASSA